MTRLLLMAAAFAALFPQPVPAQIKKAPIEESMFLDLQKTGLGTLNDMEEKKKFLDTVQLEKQRLQYKMVKNIYENAYSLYKEGSYEDAGDLASRILAIDPNFKDAEMLKDASTRLKGSLRPGLSEKNMIEEKFNAAFLLYKDGRIVESHNKMDEVVKLSPNNVKAKYWLAKMKEDLKDYYVMKGEELYAARDLKGSLDNFYNALMIRPRGAEIIERISTVEDELRREQSSEKLKAALEAYAQGRVREAYDGLKKALEIQPGDARAGKLLKEVSGEIEKDHIARGRKLYGERKYADAIAEWAAAKAYANDSAYLEKLISRAREQIRFEAAEKKRRAGDAAARSVKENEEKQKQETAAAAAESGTKAAAEQQPEPQKQPVVVTEENRRSARQYNLEAFKYFQSNNFEKAREQWTIAKQLDPGNADADAGLKRIEQILAGGQ